MCKQLNKFSDKIENIFLGAGDGLTAPKNKFSRCGCQRNENWGTHNPGSKHDQAEDGPPTHDDGRYGIESPGSSHPPTWADAHKNGPGLHRHRRPGEVLFLPLEDTCPVKDFLPGGNLRRLQCRTAEFCAELEEERGFPVKTS